jgi:OmpA family
MKIGGYTDKVGKDDSNLKLSDSRAKAVQAVLAKAGVGAQVPQAEGYGETQAKVAETASDEERKADRKTAIRLLKGDGAAKPTDANAKPADANAKPAATVANANAATAKPADANAKPANATTKP